MYPQNNFFCMIDGGVIYQVDTYSKVPIGYTNDEYNTLAQTTQEYYDKLVELGAIVPPKTQDEITADLQRALADSQRLAQEQQRALIESQNTQQELLKLMQEMRANNEPERVKPSAENVSVSKPKQRSAKSAAGDAGEIGG